MSRKILTLYGLLLATTILADLHINNILNAVEQMENHHADLSAQFKFYEDSDLRLSAIQGHFDGINSTANDLILTLASLQSKLGIQVQDENNNQVTDPPSTDGQGLVKVPGEEEEDSDQSEVDQNTDLNNITDNTNDKPNEEPEIDLFNSVKAILDARKSSIVNSVNESTIFVVVSSNFSVNGRFIEKITINGKRTPVVSLKEVVTKSVGSKVKSALAMDYYIELKVKKGVLKQGENVLEIQADKQYTKDFIIIGKKADADRKVPFIGIADIFDIYDPNWPNADIKLNTEVLWVVLNSKFDDIDQKSVVIEINDRPVKILKYLLRDSDLVMRKQAYAYHIELEVPKDLILPGINNVKIKSGIMEYFESFISH